MISTYFLRCTLLAMFVCASAFAKKPAPLAGFDVTTLDGKPVHSAELHLKGHWLLVYIDPRSVASDSMLEQLKEDKQDAANAKLIVIVGCKDAIEARTAYGRYGHLKNAIWYVDIRHRALRAMQIA